MLLYFPFTPRSQRLYILTHTVWVDDDVLRHPADGKVWKEFDYPNYATEPRNTRLGLASDEFNPFGNFSSEHNTQPVVVLPYNLPLEVHEERIYDH